MRPAAAILAVICITAVLACPALVVAAESPDSAPQAAAAPIAISRDTTFFDGPLTPNGYVDYVAAVNEAYRRGVTPQNNAAAILWEVVGPSPVDAELRDDFFRALGADLDLRGPRHLLPFDPHVFESSDAAYSRLDAASEGPRRSDSDPELARWFEDNHKLIDRLVEGSRRTGYYSPLLSGDSTDRPPVMMMLLPDAQTARLIARILAARAMLRAAEGRVDDARRDLIATHRWARLVGKAPPIICLVVAAEIEAIACRGDALLAHHCNLSHEQLQRFAADLLQLAPFPALQDKINLSERASLLDAATFMARGGRTALEKLGGESVSTLTGILTDGAVEHVVDWSEVLREINQWVDRLVAVPQNANRSARVEAYSALEADILRNKAILLDPSSGPDLTINGVPVPKRISRHVAMIITTLLTPHIGMVMDVRDRADTKLNQARLAIALAAYRDQHGRYPPKLSQLAPDSLADIPADAFSDTGFRYQSTGSGYVLYSVGPNGEDEGGRYSGVEPKADDVSVADTAGPPLFLAEQPTGPEVAPDRPEAPQVSEHDTSTFGGWLGWAAGALGLAGLIFVCVTIARRSK